MDNCDFVLNCDNKLNREQLVNLIDDLTNPRDLVVLFMINTCELGLQHIDNEDEKKRILEECCGYFARVP